jgi:hypothetical protein
MRITLPFDLSATTDRRKVEIHRLLSTKKYRSYFYRTAGLGKIPPTFFEKIVIKCKAIWKILFSKVDANIAYPYYINEVMHKTHMMSLLEKQVKLKCLGIVSDYDGENPISPEDKVRFQQQIDETANYENQMSEYLKDDPEFKKLHDNETQRKIDMMKLYVESNSIDDSELFVDKFFAHVSKLRERDE